MNQVHEPETPPASQMDDINIPLVAVSVAFFAAFLAVTIVSLQAAFYNYQSAETLRKTVAQEDPHTTLGAILKMQRHELQVAGHLRTAATTGPATQGATASRAAASQPVTFRIPIDRAMDKVVAQYAAAQAAGRSP